MTPRSEYWEHENEGRLRCDEWCAPLHLVEQAIAGTMLADRFSVDRFMIGPRLVRAGRPALHLYKHADTGQYLNVDTRGAVYRYVPPNPKGISDGRWVKYKLLAQAIRDLDLDTLELDAEQHAAVLAKRRRRPRRQSA